MFNKDLVQIDVFLQSISSILEDNLTSYLINTVSNMLALHYAVDNDLRSKNSNIYQYSDLCAGRIKSFLQEKVILEEKFDTAIEVFAIAITPNLPPSEDLPPMSKIRDNEKATEAISMNLAGMDLSSESRDIMCDVTDISLGSSDAKDVISFMGDNPSMMRAIIGRKNRKAQDIVEELTKAAKLASKKNIIMSDFVQLSGLITCAIAAFAGNILTTQIFDAIAASVVIPVSVIALRYGANLGEVIGAKVVEFEADFKVTKSNLESSMSSLVPFVDLSVGVIVHESVRSQGAQQERSSSQADIAKLDIKDIKQNLSAHIDNISTEKEVKEIQKTLKEINDIANAKSTGREK